MGGTNWSRQKDDAAALRREPLDRIHRRRERRGPDEEHGGDIVQRSIERFGRGEIAGHDLDTVRQIARLRVAAEGANREISAT